MTAAVINNVTVQGIKHSPILCSYLDFLYYSGFVAALNIWNVALLLPLDRAHTFHYFVTTFAIFYLNFCYFILFVEILSHLLFHLE